MPEHKILGTVDRIEPVEPPQTCPICETPLQRVVRRDREGPRAYFACECAARAVDSGDDSDDPRYRGVVNHGLEGWGEVILHIMRTHPDRFPPGSMPGPVEGLDDGDGPRRGHSARPDEGGIPAGAPLMGRGGRGRFRAGTRP